MISEFLSDPAMVVAWVMFGIGGVTTVYAVVAGNKPLALTGVGVWLYAIAVIIVFMLDQFATTASQQFGATSANSPDFVLNFVMTIITGLAAIAGYFATWCFAWAEKDRTSHQYHKYRWLETTASFLGASLLGVAAAEFWLSADFYRHYPNVSGVAQNLVEGFLWGALVSAVVLIVLVAVRRKDLWADIVEATASGRRRHGSV